MQKRQAVTVSIRKLIKHVGELQTFPLLTTLNAVFRLKSVFSESIFRPPAHRPDGTRNLDICLSYGKMV